MDRGAAGMPERQSEQEAPQCEERILEKGVPEQRRPVPVARNPDPSGQGEPGHQRVDAAVQHQQPRPGPRDCAP